MDNGAGAALEGELKIVRRGNDAEAALLSELGDSLDFGEHGAGSKVTGSDVGGGFGGSEQTERDLVGLTVIKVSVGNGGDGDENIGFDKVGKLGGGEIFINHGVNAFKDFEDFSADDGDTAATDGDYDGARLNEGDDFAALNDVNGFRRRDDAAITPAGVFVHFPAARLGELDGFGGGIELADGFRGMAEGGIFAVHNYLGDHADNLLATFFLGEGVVDGLGEPIADLALTHGDGGFQRHGGRGGGGGGFFVDEDVADLGTVTVGDDDFVFIGKLSNHGANLASDGFLGVGGDFAVALEGIATQGDDDTGFTHRLSISEIGAFGKWMARVRALRGGGAKRRWMVEV